MSEKSQYKTRQREELQGLSEHVLTHHGFRINPLRTVFYGVCDECREAEK